jgi:hypothetical protein
MRVIRIPSPRGGNQDTVTLCLDRIHGWLFTIDSSRVKDEIRDRVQAFQRECYEVLFRHFSSDRERLMREANDAESLSLRLVTEARHIWGERVAAKLWGDRGLPKVPEMDDVFKQGELFEQSESKKAA